MDGTDHPIDARARLKEERRIRLTLLDLAFPEAQQWQPGHVRVNLERWNQVRDMVLRPNVISNDAIRTDWAQFLAIVDGVSWDDDQ